MKARNEYDLIGRNISSEEYLKLESLKIVDGITNVPPQSFRSHPNLRTVNISDSINIFIHMPLNIVIHLKPYLFRTVLSRLDRLLLASVKILSPFLLDWGLKKLTGSHLIVVLT